MTKQVLEILCFGLAFCGRNRRAEQRRGSSDAALGRGVVCGVEGEGSVERGGERRKSANGWRKSKCTFCSPPIYV